MYALLHVANGVSFCSVFVVVDLVIVEGLHVS